MKECYRVLRKENGQLILSFHHWDYRGWAALTSALSQANFNLSQRYVVHSENPSSVHIAGQRALSHDALLVFTPGQSTKKNGWMRPESLDMSDSARFCSDCSKLLGWMLESKYSSDRIYSTWKSMMSSWISTKSFYGHRPVGVHSRQITMPLKETSPTRIPPN